MWTSSVEGSTVNSAAAVGWGWGVGTADHNILIRPTNVIIHNYFIVIATLKVCPSSQSGRSTHMRHFDQRRTGERGGGWGVCVGGSSSNKLALSPYTSQRNSRLTEDSKQKNNSKDICIYLFFHIYYRLYFSGSTFCSFGEVCSHTFILFPHFTHLFNLRQCFRTQTKGEYIFDRAVFQLSSSLMLLNTWRLQGWVVTVGKKYTGNVWQWAKKRAHVLWKAETRLWQELKFLKTLLTYSRSDHQHYQYSE